MYEIQKLKRVEKSKIKIKLQAGRNVIWLNDLLREVAIGFSKSL